jgi:hypothetical protein
VDELEAMGVRLVMVSIGIPQKGKELIDHLGFEAGEKYLHVDPENNLYDLLKLNSGIKETFFTPSTPLAFVERLKKPDGVKDLLEVLSKWNKAFYIPPEQSQAFNQGGTFVFDGPATVFAHYDESTGAHSDIQVVLGLVEERAKKKASTQKSAFLK